MPNLKSKGTSNTDLVELVYPQLDTENSRWFFFSSANLPFGMVNLSSDTEIEKGGEYLMQMRRLE